METNIKTTPVSSLYTIIIPQYAEGNHCNAANGELLRFGDAACFEKYIP